MGAPAVAAGASLLSVGLSAYADIEKGKGQQAADEYQAARADQAAKFGRLQASLTDVTMRERLNTTLGNIDAIRAAGNVDPTSPTTGAVEDWNRMLSDRQRTAAVVTARSQADADEAGAAYLRKAGSYAQQMSYLLAASGVAGGVAKAAGSFGGSGAAATVSAIRRHRRQLGWAVLMPKLSDHADRDACSPDSPGDSLARQTDPRTTEAGPTEQRTLAAPVSRGTALASTARKSAAKQVTGKLKVAIDAMCWSGKNYQEAGESVGLSARHMRRALEKPWVLGYMDSQKRALRASELPRTIVRLAELRDQMKIETRRWLRREPFCSCLRMTRCTWAPVSRKSPA